MLMQKMFNKMLPAFLLCGEGLAANESGVIPAVSNHYQAKPVLYDFDHLPAENFGPNIQRRFVMGSQSMMTRWDIKAGTRLPLHFHPNEQITRVEKGQLEVYSQGDKYVVKPGQVMIFAANVPHEFVGVKDTSFVEYHTPARQDFVNGEFNASWRARTK